MVSENLKRVRKEHKMTQQDIADVLGIDRSTYTFYETGKTSPSIATLYKLSNIYNVTIGYLAGYEENRPELKTRHISTIVSASEIDPIAHLSKEEQLILMCYRVAQAEKKQEILRFVRNVASEEET